jgi:type II secretory pathway component PulC
MRQVVVGMALGMLACASKQPMVVQTASEPKPVEVVLDRPAPAPVDSPRVSLASVEGDGYLGVIERQGLVAIVDQGLGRFLQHLRLEPAMANGKFGGFRVASVDPAWKGAGIESGDVITRLNGQPIERPEQAMAAFESLRTASELSVDFTRGGAPANLRLRIE